MRTLACPKVILRANERSCLTRLQSLISSRHRCLYCWTLEMMIQMSCLQFKWKCLLIKLPFVCQSFKVFPKYEYIFSLGQNRLSGTVLPNFTWPLWGNLVSRRLEKGRRAWNPWGVSSEGDCVFSFSWLDVCFILKTCRVLIFFSFTANEQLCQRKYFCHLRKWKWGIKI
jgi:hypothetical protein